MQTITSWDDLQSRERVIPLTRLKNRTGVTDEQLDQDVDDDALDTLSDYIVDYRKYGPRLGLSSAKIKNIEQDPALFYSMSKKTAEVFKEWHKKKSSKGSDATYRDLIEVALQLEDGIAAEKICQICYESKFLFQ